MRLLTFFLIALAVECKSSSRGSSRSRSSVSSSSRSSSSSSRSSSSWSSLSSSGSNSKSSSGGWFSFGSSFKSKNKPSTAFKKPSSGSSSISRSGSFGSSSWFTPSSSRSPRPTPSWNLENSLSYNSRSRGNSAARTAVANAISSTQSRTNRQQKIRRKLSDVASSIVPGAAQRAAQTVRPNLSTYASEYRRRSRLGYYGRSNYYLTSYYPYRTYYRHRYHSNSNDGRYGTRGQKGPQNSENSTEYDRFDDFERNLSNSTVDRNETLDTQRRFTKISDVVADPLEVFIPYNDDFLAECPNKVDAFLQLDNISFIFEDHHMFLIEDGALNQTSAISDLFLGVHKVDASVYDMQLDAVLLFQERKVFGFRWVDSLGEFKTLSGFPKNLPDSIKLTPSAAFIWYDAYPVLVSDKGDFAIYDSFENTEVKVENQITRYLESIPEPVRGISHWGDDQALIFTENKVYQFDLRNSSIIGEPESLDDFLGCFFVEIPSGEENKTK